MNPHALKTYLEGLKEIQLAIQDKATISEGLWEAVEAVLVLHHQVKQGEVSSVRDVITVELSFAEWLLSVSSRSIDSDKALLRVNASVEVFAAHLEAGDTVDDVGDDVIGVIGEERVKQGQVFVEWFDEQVGYFTPENGHLMLAKGLGRKCVYHAGKSGDKGVYELVWHKVARRWEWMAGHPDGFVVAGRELVAIDRDRLGRVLMQYGHLGEKEVALKVALYGGDPDMALEVRHIVGEVPITPLPGFDRGWLGALASDSDGEITHITAVGSAHVVTAKRGSSTLSCWDMMSRKVVKTFSCPGPVSVLESLSSDHRFVVACQSKLRVFQMHGGEFGAPLVGHKGNIVGVAHKGSTLIVSAAQNGELFVWNYTHSSGWTLASRLGDETRSFRVLLGLEEDHLIVSACIDREIVIWDVRRKEEVKVLKGHSSRPSALGQLPAPDGRIVSAAYDGSIRIWSGDGTDHKIIKCASSVVHAIAVSSTGAIIVSCLGASYTAYDASGTVLGTWKGGRRGSGYGLALVGDEMLVAVGHYQPGMIWDLRENLKIGDVRPSKSEYAFGGVLAGDASVVLSTSSGLSVYSPVASGEEPSLAQRLFLLTPMRSIFHVPRAGLVGVVGSQVHVFQVGGDGKWGRAKVFQGQMQDANARAHFALRIRDGSTLVLGTSTGILSWDWKTCVSLRRLAVGLRQATVLSGANVLMLTDELCFIENLESSQVLRRIAVPGDVRTMTPAGNDGVVMLMLGGGIWAGGSRHNIRASRVFHWLWEDVLLLEMENEATEIVLWEWEEEREYSRLGGLVGRDIVTILWDHARGLAVVITRNCSWLAYRLESSTAKVDVVEK